MPRRLRSSDRGVKIVPRRSLPHQVTLAIAFAMGESRSQVDWIKTLLKMNCLNIIIGLRNEGLNSLNELIQLILPLHLDKTLEILNFIV